MKLLSLWLLLAWPVVAPAQFTYTTNSGAITITEYIGAGGAVTIPGTINGYPVTAIGTNAFYQDASVTGVAIPNGITSIGDYAFQYCLGLTNVMIPISVTNMGADAFADCARLTAAYFLGDAPPDVGTAFYGSSLAKVYYLTGTTGWKAMFGGVPTAVWLPFTYTTNNSAITITGYTGPGGAVVIPELISVYQVIGIGGDAFYGCTNLTSVTIPIGVTSIGADGFYGCTSLTNMTIPQGVTNIGFEAFSDCSSLTKVTIPNSVTSIGAYAFTGCPGLTSVTIPSRVTNIGAQAFYQCPNLIAAYFQGNVPPDAGNAFQADSLATVYYLSGATGWSSTFGGVPAVEETDPSEFTYTTNSGAITITGYTGPGGAVIIPDLINGYPVTGIGANAFIGASLTSVVIPNSVTTIGDSVFVNCMSLTSVTLPDSLISIGEDAFAACGLTNITVAAGNPDYSSVNGVLFDLAQATLIQYPLGLGGSYTIPNSVTNIGGDAFYACSNLTSVTIPSSVTSIGGYAFGDCLSLTAAYFLGNAPPDNGSTFQSDPAMVSVYYLPWTTGWGSTFGGVPTAAGAPQLMAGGAGVLTSQFGFSLAGTNNEAFIVSASTNLANPVWVPIQTNTLNGGTFYFSDPQWANYRQRFYQLSSP